MSDQLFAKEASYTTHNKHKRNIHASAGFEAVIPANKRLQTDAIDSTANRIGLDDFTNILSLFADNHPK
jgi:hypothetical protein